MQAKHRRAETPVDPDLKFQVTEAYKVARTNLSFSVLKQGCKAVVITSPLAGEGKTTTAVNLARALAQQAEVKVLLIDSDLRKPRLHEFFSLENVPGLTNFLGNLCGLEEILRPTELPNLAVLCSGVSVPNPSELLAGAAMESLLGLLKENYDYILLDTSPVNIVVDALPLAKLCDGAVIVVREGFSSHPELQKTVEALRKVNAKILGVILNGIRAKRRDYSYRYEP